MTYTAFNVELIPNEEELVRGISRVVNMREMLQAAARGVSGLVKRHFHDRNKNSPPNPFGLPKSNYWALAADATRTYDNVVEIDKEGVAIHLYGGIIRPKAGKKALAIPIDPSVADVNPSEYDPNRKKTFVTPGGAIGDKESGKILWILVPQVKINPDRSVLPSDAELLEAASESARDYMEAMK